MIFHYKVTVGVPKAGQEETLKIDLEFDKDGGVHERGKDMY